MDLRPPGHEKILFFPKAMDMDMDSESSDVQARPDVIVILYHIVRLSYHIVLY